MTPEPPIQTERLELLEPSVEYRDDFLAMVHEYLAEGDPHEQTRYEEARKDFAAYVRRLRDMACGIGLKPGLVPETTFWLVRDRRTIVAVSSLRHYLNEHLEHEGGHIGYGTRPSERRKGYGTRLCALTLEAARRMGLKRVLITCDTDNTGSRRILEKNGGRLENQVVSRATGKRKNRYWFDL